MGNVGYPKGLGGGGIWCVSIINRTRRRQEQRAMLCCAMLSCTVCYLFDSSHPQDNQSLHKHVHNIPLDIDKTKEKPEGEEEEGKERARNMNVCVLSMDGCNKTTRVLIDGYIINGCDVREGKESR